LVVPSVPGRFAAVAEMFVGTFEKLVINNIYHCPATAAGISTCSVAAIEKLQSMPTAPPLMAAHIEAWVANGPHKIKSISTAAEFERLI
jgi:hypothetical protein